MILILVFALFALLIGLKGFYESTKKQNSFKLTPYLFWMGIFVWGDAVVFGLLWFLIGLLSYLFNDYWLFFLSVSVFWLVRSIGETIYWINEQFVETHRNQAQNLWGHSFFNNDSIFFIYQIFWQCISVISVISTIYLSAIWLKGQL
jgi:hypothetical protein